MFRRSESGRIHPEFSILLALAGIGAALSMPQILRWTRHEVLTTSNWVWMAIGVLAFLLGAGPLVWAFGSVLLEERRRRKG